MYWESEELGAKENLLFLKMETIDEVVRFCKLKHMVSYCIFDDLGLNIYTFGNGSGQFNTIPKQSRKHALEQKEKKENENTIS